MRIRSRVLSASLYGLTLAWCLGWAIRYFLVHRYVIGTVMVAIGVVHAWLAASLWLRLNRIAAEAAKYGESPK